jgi:hypothetical protein
MMATRGHHQNDGSRTLMLSPIENGVYRYKAAPLRKFPKMSRAAKAVATPR